jgi:hypothetical protein
MLSESRSVQPFLLLRANDGNLHRYMRPPSLRDCTSQQHKLALLSPRRELLQDALGASRRSCADTVGTLQFHRQHWKTLDLRCQRHYQGQGDAHVICNELLALAAHCNFQCFQCLRISKQFHRRVKENFIYLALCLSSYDVDTPAPEVHLRKLRCELRSS